MISCLTVTLPTLARIQMLKRSICSYESQTYDDKELVVVVNSEKGSPEDCNELHQMVSSFNNPSIRVIDVQEQSSMGRLRNISVSEARGDIVCQWDDDDIFHQRRLAEQYAFLKASDADANILSEVLLFQNSTRTLYYTNWSQTDFKGFTGSLMCKKKSIPQYPDQGANSRFTEDSYVAKLLLDAGRMQTLKDKAFLLAYVFHGGNTWSEDFFEMLKNTLVISKGLLQRKKGILLEEMPFLNFGSQLVSVEASNGEGFLYQPKG